MCRHRGELGVRWDYLTQDETVGTGWIVCLGCESRVERITVAGGRFRGSGRFLAAFQEQISEQNAFAGLRELEVD